MSAEDDVDKVNEVTAKLAGPLKVWVLHLYGDHGPDILLFRTKDAGLEAARKDMANFIEHEIYIANWLKELQSTGYVQIDGRYNYRLRETEVHE